MAPFEAVVRDHGAAVLRVLQARLDPHDAEDAWSETFLAALRAYPALPPDISPSGVQGWLVTIAKRKAVDQHRARARRPQPVAELPDTPVEPVLDGPDLVRAIDRLPPRQRACVAQHYLAGLPYDEVAALVGGTPAAARRAAADGIATLRRTQLLEEHP